MAQSALRRLVRGDGQRFVALVVRYDQTVPGTCRRVGSFWRGSLNRPEAPSVDGRFDIPETAMAAVEATFLTTGSGHGR